MIEKLDNLSKVLLATGTINYMAAGLDRIIQNVIVVPDKQFGEDATNFLTKSHKAKEERMEELVKDLSTVVENIANYMNSIDAVCAIDIRATKVPCEILLHDMDEVENYYDEED